MMRIAYGNYGMPALPWEATLRQVAAIGYDGIELCVGSGYATAPDALDQQARRALRHVLSEVGLALESLLLVGVTVAEPDANRHAANLERLRSVYQLGQAAVDVGNNGWASGVGTNDSSL